MEQAEILKRVQERFADRVVRSQVEFGQAAVTVRPEDLREVVLFLRDDPDLAFEQLIDVGGVDYLGYPDEEAVDPALRSVSSIHAGREVAQVAEPAPVKRQWRFEVAYQFRSLTHGHRFRVKVAVPDDPLEVPSLWDIWRTANWMEREVFDQYGVRFRGHPNLRRILNHEDFRGHPLRKDYPINKRQRCTRPIENLLTDDPEWA